MNTKANAPDDPNRRTDLRTVEPHYSAREVYAALDCPYPGTDADHFHPPTSGLYNPGGRGIRKAQGQRPAEGNAGGTSFSSATSGIKLPLASSGYAVRRGRRFSGFVSGETDEYVRYNPGGLMKTKSHPDDDREQHRPVTDGGTVERTNADLPIGARVEDRDDDDPNPAVITALPEEPAYARVIDALDGDPSVADLNPDYPASGPVATVAYAGDLDRALDVWRKASPEALAAICEDYEVRTYDFPTARLRPADEFTTGGEHR